MLNYWILLQLILVLVAGFTIPYDVLYMFIHTWPENDITCSSYRAFPKWVACNFSKIACLNSGGIKICRPLKISELSQISSSRNPK